MYLITIYQLYMCWTPFLHARNLVRKCFYIILMNYLYTMQRRSAPSLPPRSHRPSPHEPRNYSALALTYQNIRRWPSIQYQPYMPYIPYLPYIPNIPYTPNIPYQPCMPNIPYMSNNTIHEITTYHTHHPHHAIRIVIHTLHPPCTTHTPPHHITETVPRPTTPQGSRGQYYGWPMTMVGAGKGGL